MCIIRRPRIRSPDCTRQARHPNWQGHLRSRSAATRGGSRPSPTPVAAALCRQLSSSGVVPRQPSPHGGLRKLLCAATGVRQQLSSAIAVRWVPRPNACVTRTGSSSGFVQRHTTARPTVPPQLHEPSCLGRSSRCSRPCRTWPSTPRSPCPTFTRGGNLTHQVSRSRHHQP